MDNSMKELEALLCYLVKHNREHAEEILGLAQKALQLNKRKAHCALMAGVKDLQESTEHLEAALAALRDE